MTIQNVIAQHQVRAIERDNDPIEQILDQHGVPKRTKHTMAEGPRQPEAIAAIITDIQLMRGTRH